MVGWLLRFLLFVLVVWTLLRAVWRFLVGVVDGASGTARRRAPEPTRLVQDPVCGTYVVQSRALTEARGETTLYFCSEQCRTSYRQSEPSGRRSSR